MYRGVADFLESEKSAEKSGYVWVSFFVENPCSDDFSGIAGVIGIGAVFRLKRAAL